MSNHHLRSMEISLKAKGLLSVMLSLPDNWDYTIKGLAFINKEGIDSIRSTIYELEAAGYVERHRIRDSRGQFKTAEYIIRETPIYPRLDSPTLEDPTQALPTQNNPTQIIKEGIIKDKIKTDKTITHSFVQAQGAEGMNEEAERERIKRQIEYDTLVGRYSQQQLDELLEIMLEVSLNRSKTIKIGKDQEYPREFVQKRFASINASHIERVMDGISDNPLPVRSTRAYLLAVLFNSVSTIDHYYTIQANTDFPRLNYSEPIAQRYERDYSFEPGESL